MRFNCLGLVRGLSSGLSLSFRRIMSSNSLYVPPDVPINFCKGEPSLLLLEKSKNLLKIASEKSLSKSDAIDLMLYGPDCGSPHFLSSLGKFLSDQYKETVNKDTIIETAGATNGLHLLASTFFKPGDLVFAEEYSYFVGIKLLREATHLNLQPVHTDVNGINPDELEKCIQSHSVSWQQWSPTPSRPYWSMLYLVPQFQNPTGVCLSPERSKRIVELARKYSLLIVCDDVYNCLYFPKYYNDRPPTRLFAFDDPSDSDYSGGHVVSNSSFSKLFAPGVRCGWMEVPQRIMTTLLNCGILFSGGALSHAMAGLLTEVMDSGHLSAHVQESRLINQDNCATLMNVFQSRIPFVKFLEPTGGYFLWLKLPDDFPLSAEDFAAKCQKEKNVSLFAGKIYCIKQTESTKYLRLAYSRCKTEELIKGAHLISDLITELYMKQY